MADEAKLGTDWTSDELDAIVADYFAMLESHRAGRPYIKARHSKALMDLIGRTHRSVEFKHQNISAVLDEIGLPWIPGYKPKRNYQKAIFAAIDRYLTAHPAVFEIVTLPSLHEPSPPTDIFVPLPAMRVETAKPRELQRLIRKFDPVERDHRNRTLGRAGEEFVVELERRRLTEGNRRDLAAKVRWIAAEEGDGAGYDILSFDPAGRERLLEVKTTNGSLRTPFFITRNECAMAAERPDDWSIYRLHLFSTQPRIFTIVPPLERVLHLNPECWRASF